MKHSRRLQVQRIAVWASRLIVGLTFILSGWAKSIDIHGFIIKVGEYLHAWGFTVPEEVTVTFCSALAAVEFCTGVMLVTGSLKRVAVWTAAAMMLVMLPLTFYIWIADPVSDCGCFGDLWHISNGATFAKNIALTALTAYLFIRNTTVPGLYPAAIQWLEVTAATAFPLWLAFVGYQVQPVLDFRPYTVGSIIFTDPASDTATDDTYIYEKAGQRQAFTLDALPDSTWTFIDVVATEGGSRYGGDIEVRDADGDQCNGDIVSPTGSQLFLIVPSPDLHYLSNAHFVERLAAYAARTGVGFCAVIGEGAATEQWVDWTRPDFTVCYADPTSLKQLVRGKEALIYTVDGRIRWKRTLSSLPADLPDAVTSDALDQIGTPDSGSWHTAAATIFLAAMAIIYLLGLSPKFLAFLRRLVVR